MLDKFFRLGPDWFGHYKRIRKIGQGGMAVVFEGEDFRNGKKVVIKVLNPSKFKSKKDSVWEGEIAKNLRHPNLVETYACGKKKGQRYIVMEVLDGPDLKVKSAARDPWLNGKRIDILSGIAKGLSHMHRIKLVHRDFNSSNVMFRGEIPVIIDFGLTISTLHRLINTGDRRGTPSYMAPELVLKNQVDQRTDIYAFGVVMYEMATGRLPFAGDGEFDRMQKNISAEAKPPSKIVPGIAGSLDSLILRAMCKNPDKRVQTMDEILGHLSRMSESDFGGSERKQPAAAVEETV